MRSPRTLLFLYKEVTIGPLRKRAPLVQAQEPRKAAMFRPVSDDTRCDGARNAIVWLLTHTTTVLYAEFHAGNLHFGLNNGRNMARILLRHKCVYRYEN